MKYLMIISHDDIFTPPDGLFPEISAWMTEMTSKGVRIHGNPLRPANEAATVRVRHGKVILTPGPLADSEEKMCAYELIECASLEQAVEVASSHPMARVATIEVRPVWTELTQLPALPQA